MRPGAPPAYLWSSNPLNISLYKRHGFEIAGAIQVGSSPFYLSHAASREIGLISPVRSILAHPFKLEMRALFTALARRVRRFHVEEEERMLHNILRDFSRLIVTVE